MEKHITILGVLYIVLGALGLAGALIIFFVLIGAGLISGDEEAIAVTSVVGLVAGTFLAVISLPGIIGGIGLLKWQQWARIFVLILGFINLFNLPFGTILGAYTIWALMNDELIKLYNATASARR